MIKLVLGRAKILSHELINYGVYIFSVTELSHADERKRGRERIKEKLGFPVVIPIIIHHKIYHKSFHLCIL